MDAPVPPAAPRLLALLAVLTAPLAAFVVLTHGDATHQAAITAFALMAAIVATHAAAHNRSPAQLALTTGIVLWTAGSAICTLELIHGPYTTYPTLAERFWLASYPALWIGVMLMSPRWGAGHWLDGIVACLGAAAVCVAVLTPELTVAGLTPLGAAVASAFTIGDFLLIAFTAAALVLTRRWTHPQWRRLAIGIVLLAGTDLLFAMRLADTTDAYTSRIDAGWVLGLSALALVRPVPTVREAGAARQPLIPVLCSAAALIVLVVDHYHHLSDGAIWLAVAALALGVARTVDAARSTARLAEAERLALTDELTRVGNRRRLFRDLNGALERGEATRLALFDLNGFKAHNDTQGHVSGDALLASRTTAH